MIITEFDQPLAAEDARKISINNRDDSAARSHFRELMGRIKESASYGYTRITTAYAPRARSYMYSIEAQEALKKLGYKVVEKRAMEWDDEKKDYSTEKPALDSQKRETFFLEITWG